VTDAQCAKNYRQKGSKKAWWRLQTTMHSTETTNWRSWKILRGHIIEEHLCSTSEQWNHTLIFLPYWIRINNIICFNLRSNAPYTVYILHCEGMMIKGSKWIRQEVSGSECQKSFGFLKCSSLSYPRPQLNTKIANVSRKVRTSERGLGSLPKVCPLIMRALMHWPSR